MYHIKPDKNSNMALCHSQPKLWKMQQFSIFHNNTTSSNLMLKFIGYEDASGSSS